MDDFSEVTAVKMSIRDFRMQIGCSSPSGNITQDQFPDGVFTSYSLKIALCVYVWAA